MFKSGSPLPHLVVVVAAIAAFVTLAVTGHISGTDAFAGILAASGITTTAIAGAQSNSSGSSSTTSTAT